MRYALEVVDGVDLLTGLSPLPVGAIEPVPNWDEVVAIPWYYLKIVNGQVVEKTQAEKDAYDLAHPPTIEEQQAAARLFLADTDWYACRLADTGVAIPVDVANARQDARELL